jgi:spermidine synthase
MPPPTKPPHLHQRAPLVETRRGVRTLEFMSGNLQSAMRVARPDQLILAYVRAMMGFALFLPRPRHILMVGLGGGSMAKFCHRHFPDARITVVELRADVIALRELFLVPPDSARFQVIHGDAVDVIASMNDEVDVLIVDGFDEAGLPPALGSAKFYASCRRAMRDGGVMVANVFSYDHNYTKMVHRLSLVFNERLCWFDGVAGNNRILYALKLPFKTDPALAPTRAMRLQAYVARHKGLGCGVLNRPLNRLLAHLTIFWLSHRS